MKAGAYDFVTKPFDTKRLVELVARAIHRWSGRAQGPLVSVNCAAVPAELMEAEFFGAERGAYTGANARKIGKVEAASGGTLFLDEIAELPPELQAKLLRVLQERAFMRVGGTQEIHSDIRIVCATNVDLAMRVRDGGFREDLFYRLHVFPIRVPSLRERAGDVVRLAEEFLRAEAAKAGRVELRLSAEARDRLAAHEWPGNVRELKNAIERAVILSDGQEILADHLPGRTVPDAAAAPAGEDVPLLEVGRRAQREAERHAIRRALEQSRGNRTEAARKLGVSYKTLWSKLKEYEIR
jgi:DNA-binding NtrC family response regulator